MSITTQNDMTLTEARKHLAKAVEQIREVADAHESDREYRDGFIADLDQMAVDLRAMMRRLDHFRLRPISEQIGDPRPELHHPHRVLGFVGPDDADATRLLREEQSLLP